MRVACMPVFQEIWAVELQIAHLSRHVDRIVLLEATRLFSGRDKFMYLDTYLPRLDAPAGMVDYLRVDDMPAVIPLSYVGTRGRIAPENRWPLERHLRNAARRALRDLPGDAIVYVLDVDEFLDPAVFDAVERQIGEEDVFAFSLLDYRTTIATSGRQPGPFRAGYATRLHNCLASDMHYMRTFRMRRGVPAPRSPLGFRLALTPAERNAEFSSLVSPGLRLKHMPDAGWHLSHMSGGHAEFLTGKVENFAHSESSGGASTVDMLQDRHALLRDFVRAHAGRYDLDSIDPDIPDFIRAYCRAFPVLLRPTPAPARG